jgi:simple sugar transport system ATP-binding protein
MVGLARMMVGRDVVLRIEKSAARCGDPVLEVEDLHVLDDRRLEAVRGMSFEVCGGEVVAIAGVDGNGQRELVEAIVGLRRPLSGSIRLKGRDVTGATAREAIEARISHIPEDRHRRGLVLDFTIAENLVLGDHRAEPYAKRGVMRPGVIAQMARERIGTYDVRTPSERVFASALSGGNQQKVVVAREIGRDPELLVAAQPTRGLDVGAIEFVHRQIIAQRDAGKGVLLVSFELEEVMALADRILVIYEGRIAREFAAGEADDETLGYYMTGGGGSKLEPATAAAHSAGGER